MSKLNAQVKDQRCAERISIGESVDFRCNSNEEFRSATMVDFSESGMLLIMDEKHTEETLFEVRVKENEDEIIYFTVKCIRSAPCTDIDLYGYGCQIEEHHFEN